jgi:hypothetical protein
MYFHFRIQLLILSYSILVNHARWSFCGAFDDSSSHFSTYLALPPDHKFPRELFSGLAIFLRSSQNWIIRHLLLERIIELLPAFIHQLPSSLIL